MHFSVMDTTNLKIFKRIFLQSALLKCLPHNFGDAVLISRLFLACRGLPSYPEPVCFLKVLIGGRKTIALKSCFDLFPYSMNF